MNYRIDDYKYLYWKGTPIKQLYWKGSLKKEFEVPEPVVEFKGLCFTAEEVGSTIAQNIGKSGCSYSTSTDGINWQPYTLGTVITLNNAGDKVYWKGNGISNSGSSAIFVMGGKIAASGSIMSLIDELGESVVIPTGNNFRYMFINCTSLTQAPELPATTLSVQCYLSMFNACTSLTKSPELPATTLTTSCYTNMFANCSNLNYIKVGATSWNTINTSLWVSGVSSTGTFVKPSTTNIPTGANGIPSGWTVEEPKVEIVLDESSSYFIEKYTDSDIEYHKFGTIPTNSLVNVVFDHSILVAEETVGNKFTVKNAQIGGYDSDGSVIAVLTPGAEMNLEYRQVGRDEMWVAV